MLDEKTNFKNLTVNKDIAVSVLELNEHEESFKNISSFKLMKIKNAKCII